MEMKTTGNNYDHYTIKNKSKHRNEYKDKCEIKQNIT